MRKVLCIILSLFILGATPQPAQAFSFLGFEVNLTKFQALNTLQTNVIQMTKRIHVASSSMMKYGDMLLCNAVHGEASYYSLDLHLVKVTAQLVCFDTFISGAVFYVMGFFIMVISSFYLFDIAFNLTIAIVLLPIGLALWPFAWTRDKLKKIIDSVVYYTGVFMFLPLGVVLAVKILEDVVEQQFQNSGFDFLAAYDLDQSDLLRDHLGVFSFGFLAVLLCYLVALKLIPLMATEFCSHFFGGALAGSQSNPLREKLEQAQNVLKERTVGRAQKYGKDVAAHQVGKGIESLGNSHGNIIQRSIARYGKTLAKRKR